MKCLTPLLMISLACGIARGADEGRFVDLGVQITSLLLQGSTFAKMPDGGDVVCSVIRGEPAKLLVFDVRDGRLLHRMALEGAKGAWNATTASDGSVYVGTDNNGHLYRWVPGESEARDLGRVLPQTTFVWDLAAGANGEVFAGTYPAGQIVRYHPDDGSSDIGRGSVAPPEDYVRGIAYEPASGHVFAGVGAHAHLIELDPRTGKKRDILPKQFADRKFVYSVDVAAGKLLAHVTEPSQALVIDLKTRQIEATLDQVGGQQIVSAKSPYDEKLYLYAQEGICSYDLATRQAEKIGAIARQVIIGMTWIDYDQPDFPGATLVAIARPGQLVRYHPKTGKSDAIKLAVPREPVPIQSFCRGPDGKIYVGGYLSGGLTAFDPATGKSVQGSMGQPEGMSVLGDELFLGVYPQGKLYALDVTRPRDATNPRLIETLDRFEQDRPMAVLGVEELSKVFFGTIPDYGLLGGALAVYDKPTDQVIVHRDIIADQSIVSLAYINGMIIGGTSLSGGLGIEPTAKEAKLFLWDPVNSKNIFETVPVPGAGMITGLMNGPDGNVWGVADATLFIFDPAKREVVFSNRVFAIDEDARHSRWRDAFLALHRNGRIYGTVGGSFVRIDPDTRDVTVLRDKRSILLAMDDAGRIYFADRTNLIQYTPD